MKRWTNGLPGATKRLGAKMALRGLAASQPRMCADTHDGPEQIAPLQRPDTLMQLSRSLISEVHLVPHGRAIHFGTKRTYRGFCSLSAFEGKADTRAQPQNVAAVMSPRQYLGMAVRSEETSTIQPDVVRHQRGAQSRPFSEPRDRTASPGTSGRPSGTLPVQPARNML